AALQLLKYDKDAEITVLERGTIYSYGQCGLPYVVSGEIEPVDKLVSRSVHTFRDKYGIEARTNCQVNKVYAESRTVDGVDEMAGDSFSIYCDKSLDASRADPFMPAWDENDFPGVYALTTIADAESIMEYIKQGVQAVTIVCRG